MKKAIGIIFMIFNMMAWGFAMYPDYFDMRIDNGEGYKEYRFPNTTGNTIRYKMSISPSKEISRLDMSKWVEIQPEIVTIKPGDTGVVKVFAKAPEGAREAEYSFYLTATPVSIPELEEGSETIKASAAVKIAASIELAGYVGVSNSKAKLENYSLSEENGNTKLKIVMTGETPNRSLPTMVEVKGTNNYSKRFHFGRLFPGETRENEFLFEGIKKNQIREIIILEAYVYDTLEKVKL